MNENDKSYVDSPKPPPPTSSLTSVISNPINLLSPCSTLYTPSAAESCSN